MFHKNSRKDSIVGTHVDNMLAVGPPAALNETEVRIEKTVELDKRGRLRKMLGIEMSWNKEGSEVILTQTSLIESLAQQHLTKTSGDRTTPGKGCSMPQDPTLYE